MSVGLFPFCKEFLFIFLLDSTCKWYHMMFVFLWLTDLVWSSLSPFVSADSMVSFFLWLSNIPLQASPVAQQWRICPQCRRYGFSPSVGKIPWRRKWQPTPVFSPGKSHGQRSLVGCSPWGCKASHTTKCTHTHNIPLYIRTASSLPIRLLMDTWV